VLVEETALVMGPVMAANEQLGYVAAATLTETNGSLEVRRTPAELAGIVSLFASSNGWIDRVRLRSDRRWYERLYQGPDYDIWVISWLPGQSTGFHDHGASSGAFIVATGTLEEHRPGEQASVVYPGEPRAFGPDYAHDVRNASPAPAISIHAYSPPLSEMNEYDLDGNRLVARGHATDESESLDQAWSMHKLPLANRSGPSTIEQTLEAARGRLRRLLPDEAFKAAADEGAILVDIRPEAQRRIEGSIAGALTVERNVLEWRFDPASSARLPFATDHDLYLILFCSEGYASSLAADDLQKLGLHHATDVIGGFHAWRAAGLPVIPNKD
jgi:rhodanese-related sulfurtransferase/mannose-6-phosphate isomerase-like protein (cupin superfamily)